VLLQMMSHADTWLQTSAQRMTNLQLQLKQFKALATQQMVPRLRLKVIRSAALADMTLPY